MTEGITNLKLGISFFYGYTLKDRDESPGFFFY